MVLYAFNNTPTLASLVEKMTLRCRLQGKSPQVQEKCERSGQKMSGEYHRMRESVFTDHTLAYPLNYRGGVVARLSS